MVKKNIYVLFFFFSLITSSCNLSQNQSPQKVKQTRMLMDTIVEITAIDSDKKKASLAIDAAFNELQRIEKLMSRFMVSSDISRINNTAGKEEVEVSTEMFEVLKRSIFYSKITDGAFDITVGAIIVKLWPFNQENNTVPSQQAINILLPFVNYKKVFLKDENKISLADKNMIIATGGIAKGYAIDKGMDVLKKHGIKNAIINAGGDLRVIGMRGKDKLWRIGIQHPRSSDLMGTIDVKNRAIATSGDYQRYFEKNGKRYHHIINPKTGWPAEGLQSVTITANNVMDADAIATAVFVMGAEKGLSFVERMKDVETMIITDTGKKILSSGLKGKVKFKESSVISVSSVAKK